MGLKRSYQWVGFINTIGSKQVLRLTLSLELTVCQLYSQRNSNNRESFHPKFTIIKLSIVRVSEAIMVSVVCDSNGLRVVYALSKQSSMASIPSTSCTGFLGLLHSAYYGYVDAYGSIELYLCVLFFILSYEVFLKSALFTYPLSVFLVIPVYACACV